MSNQILNILKQNKQRFIRIKEIIFEKDNPQKENFQNFLSSLRNPNFTYVYLLLGRKEKCELYLGCIEKNSGEISLNDYINDILDPTFKGIFKGSQTTVLSNGDIEEDILNFLEKNKRQSLLYGIPTVDKNLGEEGLNYIDTIINAMAGTEYCLISFLDICSENHIENLEKNLDKIYEILNEDGKASIQNTKSIGKSSSSSSNESKSKGTTLNENETKSHTETKGNHEQTSKATSSAKGEQISTNESKDKSESTTKTENRSENVTKEKINKKSLNTLSIIDEVLYPRIDLAKNKGLFKIKTYLSSTNIVYLERLENIILSVSQGEDKNISPLAIKKINTENDLRQKLEKDKIKKTIFEIEENEISTLLTAKEISLIIGVPKKESIGIELNQSVDYGLNIPEILAKNKIELGNLLDRGSKINKKAFLDKKELNKHIFIGGVTGSGKTTTSHNLLLKSELPFLVIEPAKTEYRELSNVINDLKIYTLGDETTIPFRINPFEFLETENITSHVDMLKASFEASFDMEAAIPQILEAAIYKSYEEYGWDIDDNSNIYLENRSDAWRVGGLYFPTLEDLIRNIEVVVNEQGFDERLKKDYLGSIKARLQSLLIGSKGQMLNTKVSIDFEQLLNQKVVLELEEIKNGADKSLIIAIILVRLCETLKSIHLKNPNFKHITLIEEAHRLLAKISPGESANKKQAIELFTDMLAEVRKYGEALIIADQIPNKLASEVLKNTNTKIIHKIFAKDDKEAVGDTMSMNELQKNYLSNLKVGEAVVFSQNWKKPVHTKIAQITNTTNILMSNQDLKNKLKHIVLNNDITSFYPESIFLKETSIEKLEKYSSEYKKLYRLFKLNSEEFKNRFNQSSEDIKRYFLYRLIVRKKAIRIKENTYQSLEKEFEFFIKRMESSKALDIKEYILRIIK